MRFSPAWAFWLSMLCTPFHRWHLKRATEDEARAMVAYADRVLARIRGSR
jgi:hypothetical protein